MGYRNRHSVGLLFVVVLLLSGTGIWSEPVGTIEYLENDPQIVRNGRVFTGTVHFGFELRNLDLIRTGDSALVEFSLYPGSGIQGEIIVHSNSEFYLSFDESRNESNVNLLRGSSSFSIERLPRGRTFSVRTSGAVMGVRGTDFSVDTSARGEYLVTVGEGRVEVRSEGGGTVAALPGQAVEYTVLNGFRAIAVESGQEHRFRRSWMQQRLQALRADPDAALENFAGRYRENRDTFNRLYEELMQQQEIIDRWIREDRQGLESSTMEQMRQKTAVAGSLMRMAAHLILFERVYYRVVELRETLVGADFDQPQVDPEEFSQEFDRDAAMLRDRMNMVRYVMRLYAERNNGRLPF
ncbi:MAG: FecR domain-containing protein [Spirochaeta sp.]